MGRRRLYCLGDVSVPESDQLDDVSGGPKSQSEHKMLNMVWDLASNAGRLFYKQNKESVVQPTGAQSLQAGSAAGSLAGLYALRHAALGRATEGMNNYVRHVESLDHCFEGQGIRIAKIVSAGGKSDGATVMLLSSGVMLYLSKAPGQHAVAITLPEETAAAVGGGESAAVAAAPSSSTPDLCRILDVAAGEEHFLCCDDQGRVYSWGNGNDYGQLGLGYTGLKGDESTPKRIPGFGEDVTGKAWKDENGLPFSVKNQRPAPTVCAVACGRHHSVMLSATKNCIWTFGRGHKGQLALGSESKKAVLNQIDICPYPRSVGSLFGYSVDSINAAPDADHTLVLLESGVIIGFGDNTLGVCGTGETKSLRGPSVSSFVDPTTGLPAKTDCKDKKTEKRKQALDAGYGTPESYRFSNRVSYVSNEPVEGAPVVSALSTSATHTVAIAKQGNKLGCYSTGLRPIRVVQGDAHVDHLGALGRDVSTKQSALAFGRMQFGGVVAEAGKRGATGKGNHIKVAAGNGFSTMMESGDASTIWLHGAITIGGTVLVGTGKKQVDNTRRPTPSPNMPLSNGQTSRSSSPTNQLDDSDSRNSAAAVSLGPGRKAVDIFAIGNGLLILADDSE